VKPLRTSPGEEPAMKTGDQQAVAVGETFRAVLVALLLSLSFTSSIAAGELEKFRDWSDSPQALFLTSEEKRNWKAVSSDEEAERFVATYMARRGRGFREELQRRIEMADRYLSSGTTRGSETLRGRMVILLGAPTRIERTGGAVRGSPHDRTTTDIYTNVGPVGASSLSYKVSPVVFTFHYSGDEVKEHLHRDELVLRVEIHPHTGKELLKEDPGAPRFEKIVLRIAEWSVVPDEAGVVRIADFH
jgi:GWxTD domain-containing protein